MISPRRFSSRELRAVSAAFGALSLPSVIYLSVLNHALSANGVFSNAVPLAAQLKAPLPCLVRRAQSTHMFAVL